MKILYIAAEISPYASVGGLGEVGSSFPKALKDTGKVEVRCVLPLYKGIKRKLKYLKDYPVSIHQGYETCILKTDQEKRDIPVYFIQNDRFFYRDQIYGYEDDALRFYFLCKAVVETLKQISFKPDIIHTNDWHTGILPLLLKKEFPNIKSVYTIHNITYQGFLPAAYLSGILTKEEEVQLDYPEWINFMKAGILHADLLTTVSPGYREEILQPDWSCGMSELLLHRKDKLLGILNGIDTKDYDPSDDGILDYPYNISSIDQKKKNRSLLRSNYGLADTEVPLIAMITRLDYSKGIELLIKAINSLDLDKFQLLILGTGSTYYQGLLASIAASYPNIALECNYKPALAKKIYAAADIYLMPSLTEPCGLGQLYAMRYGVVPIVNPVGGLKDTVTDEVDNPKKSSGFYMESWNAKALAKAIERAISTYHTPDWSDYIRNCMAYDFSWSRSATCYLECYKGLKYV